MMACIYQKGRPTANFRNKICGVVYDTVFTAPEAMSIRWDALAHILADYYPTNSDLVTIFNLPAEYEKWLDRVPEEWKFLLVEDEDDQLCERVQDMRNDKA